MTIKFIAYFFETAHDSRFAPTIYEICSVTKSAYMVTSTSGSFALLNVSQHCSAIYINWVKYRRKKEQRSRQRKINQPDYQVKIATVHIQISSV